ncbi:MAG: hypothetical protein AAB443_02380 [Patescibacteria group bacterium]
MKQKIQNLANFVRDLFGLIGLIQVVLTVLLIVVSIINPSDDANAETVKATVNELFMYLITVIWFGIGILIRLVQISRGHGSWVVALVNTMLFIFIFLAGNTIREGWFYISGHQLNPSILLLRSIAILWPIFDALEIPLSVFQPKKKAGPEPTAVR